MSVVRCPGCGIRLGKIEDGLDKEFAQECTRCSSGIYERAPEPVVVKHELEFAEPPREKTGKPCSPTLHHVRPSSRGGTDKNNLVSLPEKFHQAYHTLAGNLTTAEAVILLNLVMVPGKKWANAELEKLRTAIKNGEYGR